jgi:hypothetical protein
MAVLKLEDWPLDKLVEYEFNPRKNDHAVDQMCAAICVTISTFLWQEGHKGTKLFCALSCVIR